MQLLLGLRDAWKCIEVRLKDGCTPCIGGKAVSDCNIEPAQWFKVLVLDSVCVDCSQRMISWNVVNSEDINSNISAVIAQQLRSKITFNESAQFGASTTSTGNNGLPLDRSVCSLESPDHGHPQATLRSSPLHHSTPPRGEGGSPQSVNSLGVLFSSPLGGGSPGGEGRTHSFMAPHDGGVSLCTDDLQNLFELAQELFGVHSTSLIYSSEQDVEQRSWLRLIHCYLLPLISLHHEDLPAVQAAQTSHFQLLASVDQQILDNSTKIMKLKSELLSLREQLLPTVQWQAEQSQCSHSFLRQFTTDLRQLEEEGRSKIQSALKNMELSQKLSMPMSEELVQKLTKEKAAGETLLIQTLELRGALESIMSLMDDPAPFGVGEGGHQRRYLEVHRELALLREKSADLSRKKVLALSVREALEQTLATLHSGTATTGMDIGLQGGHSTDVLSEASSHSAASNEYLTLKDKIQKLLCLHSSPAAHLHHSFCKHLRKEWFPTVSDDFVHISQPISQQSFTQRAATLPCRNGKKSPQNGRRHWSLMKRQRGVLTSSMSLQDLAALVKTHFQQIVDTLCQHFNDRDMDFSQQVWLCYERLFFEAFASDFLPLYQAHHAKFCEQLQLNCLSVSVLDPRTLNLGSPDESILAIFKSRSFEVTLQLYQELTDEGYLTGTKTLEEDQEFRALFGGVTSDLSSIPLAISPLERLQLLTSAFRKAMASLSELKLRSLIQQQRVDSENSLDLSLAGVSCDDLLPLLTLILLQMHPSFLANLHLQCCFLEDYIAQFLAAGWHGYSLAAFRSVLQVIAEL